VSGGRDERVERAEALLRERGLASARVAAAGSKGEIAAISAPPGAVAELAELAPRIKALGFRYVTLELPEGEGARPGTDGG
jgi:PP-loop superfamily ATP-utilizing enzyme